MRPGDYRTYYNSLLDTLPSLPTYIPNAPTVVQEKESFFAWNTSSDGHDFFFGFQKLFHINPTLVHVAESMLRMMPYNFFGIHLRVEKDWGDFRGRFSSPSVFDILLHS
jgi:hypothetical protein